MQGIVFNQVVDNTIMQGVQARLREREMHRNTVQRRVDGTRECARGLQGSQIYVNISCGIVVWGEAHG